MIAGKVVEEATDGVGLSADDKGGHALALGHRVEKVAEEVVVVYETVGFRHNMNFDRM